MMQGGDRADAPSSQYQGVAWDMQQKQWRVTVMNGRRSIQFGWYSDEEEAACAHDAAAVVIGPQAQLNFPKQVGSISAKLGSVCGCVCLQISSPSVCLASCLHSVLCYSMITHCSFSQAGMEWFIQSLHEPEGC